VLQIWTCLRSKPAEHGLRECLENAGEMDWRGKNTGYYVGSFGEDWLELQTMDTQESSRNRITGYGDYLLANRISYEYDFKGPR
jgi:acyl transferase domain-containing protein